VEPALEVGVDSLLDRRCSSFLELGALRSCEGVVEIGENRAAPERERLPQRRRRGLGILPARLLDQRLEAFAVERAGLDHDGVAGGPGDDRVPTERLAELRHVNLERRRRRVGRRPVPELVDEPIARDDPVRFEQEQRQQGPLLRPAERDRPTALQGLQRPEDPELDGRGRLL
jgi:hypothetical protein